MPNALTLQYCDLRAADAYDITDDGIVRVRLLGACVGCPSSQMTLRGGIEANLIGRVPGVTSVEAVEAA